ncbi:MAG: DUF4364 family protein [Eubacterium sp.]|nr:DUF4364 family protein [Eubacterium sp.]
MALAAETLYKLIIMYMLNKVEFPLTNTQIAQFFLDEEYTSYFNVQKAINELIEDGFMFLNVNRNTSYYHLTSEGRESLKFFENRIPNSIIDDVDMFLVNNRYELRNEVGTVSDYYRTTNGEYIVHCQVKEGESTLIEVNIATPDRQIASKMCAAWEDKDRSQEIYQYVISKLST